MEETKMRKILSLVVMMLVIVATLSVVAMAGSGDDNWYGIIGEQPGVGVDPELPINPDVGDMTQLCQHFWIN